MRNSIILCSGGIDSVTTAYYVKKRLKYGKMIILFFNYKQKSLGRERQCAKKCASCLGAEFQEIKLDWLSAISNSLINKTGKMKKLARKDLKDTREESKKFYVPCRNSLFIVYALALADSLYIKNNQVSDIFLGFKNEGKEGYPDTTKKFVKEINKLAENCSHRFRIIAPLIEKDKEDIILLGMKLGIDYRNTHSCYIRNKHCGKCLACMLRKEGFYWANLSDPTEYS